MDYIIVHGDSADALRKEVLDRLTQGYTLAGGVAVAVVNDNGAYVEWWAQAMTRRNPENKLTYQPFEERRVIIVNDFGEAIR